MEWSRRVIIYHGLTLNFCPLLLFTPHSLHLFRALDKILVTISNIATKQKSNKLKDMMEKTEVIFKGFRIQPDSKVHVVWDIFALLAIMYYSISCPVRLAAYVGSDTLRSSYDLLFILDFFLDVLFITDILLRMRVYAYVSYANGRNEVIMDRKQMQRHYVRSDWFIIDLIASIPLDLISLGTGYYAVYRLPKLVRILQISALISRLQKNLDECMQVTMNETQVSSLIMFLYSLLIVVWSSSGWNALREGESAYHSVYWAFTTLTTVGYGDLTPIDFRETCYALFVGAAGATFSAAIIANVTSFFHDTEISEDNTEHKLNVVKSFMERHHCQHEHIKKVDDYFEYIEREQDGLNEDIILNKCIPDNIRTDMLIHITQSMVLSCDFFIDCESGFIRRLMLSLEQRFFGKQYMIMTESTPADGMYFIKKGIVEILASSDGPAATALKVTKRLEADDSFAEGCLLMHWESNPFLARAATDCELWFLSRSTFNRLVNDFPRVKMLLRQRDADSHLTNGRRPSARAVLKAAEKARRNRAVFIHPDKFFMQAWVGIVLLVTLYNAIALPLRVAFLENHIISPTWIALDYLGDVCLLADFVIRGAFLAFYDDNHLVVERSKIFSNYRKSKRMKWHMLAASPLEIVSAFVPTMCPLWTLQVWSFFRLNKLLRLPEIAHLLNQLEQSLAKAGIKLPRNQLRVGKLIMVILISAHLVGCIFFLIANLNQHASGGGDNDSQRAQRANWANTEGLLDPAPTCPGEAVDIHIMWQRYVAATYWSMATLTTVGYGDVTADEDSNAEIIFSTFVLVVGTAIYTLVIALLEDIVAQLDVTSTLYETKMNAVESYMVMQGLPDDIKLKITTYYENLWRHQLGVRGGKLLKYLPRSLRSDLLFDTLSPLLQKTFFVKDCSADFVANLLRTLTLDLYLAGDVIFQEGERCDSLSFLFRGEVDLLTSNNNIKFKTVSDCLLGESSFFGFEPFICTAKAATVCEVFHLDMADFMEQLRDNHLLERFASYLQKNERSLSKSKAAIEKMTKNLNSSKMAKMLSIEEIQTTPKGVILPNSTIRQAWDTIALFFLMLLVFTIPYQISFSNVDDGGIGVGQFIMDCIIDSFFVADIYARTSRLAVMKDGALIDSPKTFRRLYLQGAFRMDIISAVPASFIGYFAGRRRHTYGLLRLFQLVRIRHLGRYLDDFVDLYAIKTGKALSTAFLRISQMFLGILFLCHWVACTFHLIADVSSSSANWLVEDGTAAEDVGARYLRSFYWALYTASTIGYGSVSVVSIGERLFAMAAMIVGAVICDAGITAVLTSIIVNRDHQASTNNRRIQCSKCYMKSNLVTDDIQDRVLDYYTYADTKLYNIDERTVLQDLSPSLKGEVLAHFCLEPMRASPLFGEFSAGALMSLVKSMKSYIAIPGERITEIGTECNSVFVLQRGLCRMTDSTGMEQNIPIGTLFGHEATRAREQSKGTPTHGLRIDIVEANGIKSKSGSPYMVLECGSMSCRTSIKKNTHWKETVVLKLPQSQQLGHGNLGGGGTSSNDTCISITVKGWRRDGVHRHVGSGNLQLTASETDNELLQIVSLKDALGKRAGAAKLKVQKYALPKDEVPTTHEQTVSANGYCHLYRIEAFEISRLREYLSRSKQDVVLYKRALLAPSASASSSIGDLSGSSTSEDVDADRSGGEADGDGFDSSSVNPASPADSSKQRQDLLRSTTSSSASGVGGAKGGIGGGWPFADKKRIAPSDDTTRQSQWRGTIKTGTIMLRERRHAGTRIMVNLGRETETTRRQPASSGSDDDDEERRWDQLVDMRSIAHLGEKPRATRTSNKTAVGHASSSRRSTFFVDWDSPR